MVRSKKEDKEWIESLKNTSPIIKKNKYKEREKHISKTSSTNGKDQQNINKSKYQNKKENIPDGVYEREYPDGIRGYVEYKNGQLVLKKKSTYKITNRPGTPWRSRQRKR